MYFFTLLYQIYFTRSLLLCAQQYLTCCSFSQVTYLLSEVLHTGSASIQSLRVLVVYYFVMADVGHITILSRGVIGSPRPLTIDLLAG